MADHNTIADATWNPVRDNRPAPEVLGQPWHWVKPQSMEALYLTHSGFSAWHNEKGQPLRNRYGRPGDRLWVRETHRPAVAHSCAMDACDCADVNVEYRADGEIRYFSDYTISDASPDWCLPKAAQRNKFVPAIHMPRWASRITLEVTGVRVERLQDISETQAEAEGIHRVSIGSGYPDCFSATPLAWAEVVEANAGHEDARLAFRDLWESINGADSWNANPWVWVVSFKRVTP